MSGFNFADMYKAAGFTPSPEIIRLRQETFDVLRKEMTVTRVLDAVRLYFELPVRDGVPWFRDAFAAADPSFTMIDSAREAAVLAACLLLAEIESGNATACIAPLAAAAVSSRTPLVHGELIERARQALHQIAVVARSRERALSFQGDGSVDQLTDALAQSGDWAKVAALSKQIANERVGADNRLAAEIRVLREEVDILWWYIGGWSRLLDRAFSELPPGSSALMAGVDLADLTAGGVGPAGSPAILHRVISAGRANQAGKVTLAESIDGLSADSLKKIPVPRGIEKATDICPVSTALVKAAEIGRSPAWHESFQSASQFDASTGFEPTDLALQIFRERKLLERLP